MKSLQITGSGQYVIKDVPMPEVGDHQVLVEIRMVATCPRWDINMMGGMDMFDRTRSPSYPLANGFPGHEAVGIVRQVGRGVQHLQLLDRVVALEHIPGEGAYAEYLCYRESDLLKLPDSVTDKQAVSFELLKCVMIGMSQFADIRGRTMLISGLGPAGILALQMAKVWGASRVVGVDLSPSRIDYVRSLGLGEAMHVDDLGAARFDLGFDCVGYAPSVQNVLEHTERHVVIFGVLRGDLTYKDAWWMRGLNLESYRYRPFLQRDRELLLDAVVNHGLNTDCIQTHHVPFTRYHEAVEMLRSQEAIKVHFYPALDFGQQAESSMS